MTIPEPGLILQLPWPNPSSDDVKLKFKLRGGMNARLTLFDVAGRRVAQKQLAALPTGSHEIVLRSKDVAGSGLYFATLCEGKECRTVRLLRLR